MILLTVSPEVWAAGGIIVVFLLGNIGTGLWLAGRLTNRVSNIETNTAALVALVQDHNGRVIKLEAATDHREDTAQDFRTESKRRFGAIELNITSIAKDLRGLATRPPCG